MKKIEGHTVELSLLTQGTVLDLGCRDFNFSKEMVKAGCCVCAYDADSSIKLQELNDKIYFTNAAVGIKNCKTKIYYELGEGAYTSEIKNYDGKYFEIEMINYNEIINRPYDLLKIDIEGGEYDILSSINFQPFPKQITVEFHEHNLPELHSKMFHTVLNNLKKWYELVYFFKENKHQYIDTLFIRR